MSIMEYKNSRFLCTLSCILLAAVTVNSQSPSYDPNINNDRIYFIEDQEAQEALALSQQAVTQPPLVFQGAVANQPLAGQWQTAGQALAIQRQAGTERNLVLANQQPSFNQWAPVSPQPLGILQNQPFIPDLLKPDRSRTRDMAKERKTIRFDGTTAALTNFSISMMQLVSRQSSGNTVVSPHSIATLLALLQQGATGETLEQLSRVLGMSQQGSAAAFRAYSDDVQQRSSSNILRTANNIFLADGFTLSPDFRAAALRDFRSDVTPTSFINSVETAREINRWVAQKTDNKIQNLITSQSLGINTQMVLVNAMYFKGLWEVPFRRETTSLGNFRLSSGNIIQAKFMMTRRYFKTGMDSYTGAKVVVIPFEREEYSLIVILPNSLSSISDTLSTLTAARLEEYLNFPYLETRLELPKFSIKADTDLSPLLQQMGISNLFTQSELSKIGTFGNNKSPQVSSAVHSAAITIDEEGGSAAASTAFAVVALSNDEPTVVFRANRPFLAVLWDSKVNLPLFTAKIDDPTL